uniref:Uncharacterized protein n=1 Tax=Anguilla anguilla TaxID=7936 RepID=A0A0E9WBZ5_ANGAN
MERLCPASLVEIQNSHSVCHLS